MTDTDTTIDSTAEVVRDLTREAAAPKDLPLGASVLLAPRDAMVHSFSTERFDAIPSRKRGRVTVHTGASLAQYVNLHTEGDATAIYADVQARRIEAVLNGHQAGDAFAGWGDHRVALALRSTPEWARWEKHDGKWMDQVTFAEFLDDAAPDIVDPLAADVVELARTFQAKANVEFRSAQVLESGERQLTYHETVEAQAGKQGQLTIPDRIEIGVAPFEGSDPYRVACRFRYRISNGDLALGFQMLQRDQVIRDAFDAVLDEIEGSTELTAYRGTAPDPTSPIL